MVLVAMLMAISVKNLAVQTLNPFVMVTFIAVLCIPVFFEDPHLSILMKDKYKKIALVVGNIALWVWIVTFSPEGVWIATGVIFVLIFKIAFEAIAIL